MAQLRSLFDLGGKVAVVTGAAGGIGAACARLLAEAGARVVATDTDLAAAAAVAAELQPRGLGIALDVTDAAAVDAAFGRIGAECGGVDILVNNAGIAIRGASLEVSTADWQRVIDVNLSGAFFCARAAAREMLKRGGGAIVNIASIMGLSGGLYPNPAYHASKGGLVNLTRAQAVEWGPSGIRVNAVAPTWIRTNLTAGLLADEAVRTRLLATMPLGRIGEAEEVAAAVLFLASPAASLTTGHTLAVDGGFLAS